MKFETSSYFRTILIQNQPNDNKGTENNNIDQIFIRKNGLITVYNFFCIKKVFLEEYV